MKIEALSNLRTYDDVNNMLSLISGIRFEYEKSLKDIIKIDDVGYPDIRYRHSSCHGDYVYRNWLIYTEDGLCGLAYTNVTSKEIKRFCEPNYLGFDFVHENCILAKKTSGTFDVFIKGKLIDANIISWDTLKIESIAKFVQLDSVDNRFLVCCYMRDIRDGIFIPQNLRHFQQYFNERILSLTYQGYLDGMLPSQIQQLYYEVQNCIFLDGNYKVLTEV